jgi:hypothetical protein
MAVSPGTGTICKVMLYVPSVKGLHERLAVVVVPFVKYAMDVALVRVSLTRSCTSASCSSFAPKLSTVAFNKTVSPG